MYRILLGIVLFFCMTGLSNAQYNQTFYVGRGPIIYPPIFVHPSYLGYYGWGYGYQRSMYHLRGGRYHCTNCGRYHRQGYSCQNASAIRGYYYNRRQNQFTKRREEFGLYYGLEN